LSTINLLITPKKMEGNFIGHQEKNQENKNKQASLVAD
jgi:hypothetical protein